MPRYSKYSVAKALTETIRQFKRTLQCSQVKVRREFDEVEQRYPRLTFDKRRLQQVLLNVLSNAVKFQSRGEIMVTASIKEDIAKKMLLEVTV